MEQAGAVFSDSLSNIQDIRDRGYTINGNPTISTGPFGNSFNFDGTGDGIDLNNETETLAFNGSTQDFAVSCWIKRGRSGTTEIFFDTRDANDDGYFLAFQDSNTVRFTFNTSDLFSAVTITDTNWHNLVFNVDRDGNITIYIDGVLDVNTASISGLTLATTTAPTLGIAFDGSVPLQGQMNNFTVFNRLLTQAEITAIATNKPFDYSKNIVSHWKMDNINPLDVGWRGNANNGTGTSIVQADIVNGIGGKGMQFDGSADLVSVPATSDFNFATSDFTISLWMKSDDVTTFRAMVAKSDSGAQLGWEIAQNNADLRFVARNGVSASVDFIGTTDSLILGQWHHVVVTRISDDYTFYVDGAFTQTVNDADSWSDSTDTLLIGARNSDSPQSFFDGTIDEVMIFNRGLTNLEVADLFSGQRSGRIK